MKTYIYRMADTLPEIEVYTGDGTAHLNGPQRAIGTCSIPRVDNATITLDMNYYSLALNPEEHQPSGTRSIPRFDNATLRRPPSPTVNHDIE